jgi:hypothetical protein
VLCSSPNGLNSPSTKQRRNCGVKNWTKRRCRQAKGNHVIVLVERPDAWSHIGHAGEGDEANFLDSVVRIHKTRPQCMFFKDCPHGASE